MCARCWEWPSEAWRGQGGGDGGDREWGWGGQGSGTGEWGQEGGDGGVGGWDKGMGQGVGTGGGIVGEGGQGGKEQGGDGGSEETGGVRRPPGAGTSLCGKPRTRQTSWGRGGQESPACVSLSLGGGGTGGRQVGGADGF